MTKACDMKFVDDEWSLELSNNDQITFEAPEGKVFTSFTLDPDTYFKAVGQNTETWKTRKVEGVTDVQDVIVGWTFGDAESDGIQTSRSMLRLKP